MSSELAGLPMRNRWCLGALAAVLACPIYAKDQLWTPPPIRLKDSSPEQLTQIRVRIFPHKRNFPPHFKDPVMHRFTLESATPCTVYDADPKTGLRKDTVITKAKTITFDATSLRSTVWALCDSPFVLTRLGRDVPSFTYDGPVQIKPLIWKGQSIVQAVIYLSLEKYLKGVVPSEVMAGWPLETLKSQAVAARTYAVFHIQYAHKYSRHPDFDVDDSVVFQAYTGLDAEHSRTNLAVDETASEILMFGDEVIQAYYHADSGGVTAAAEHAFLMHVPYCRQTKEVYRPDLVASDWEMQLTLRELNSKLNELDFIDTSNPITELVLTADDLSPSGRVRRINAHLQNGDVKYISIKDLKRALPLNSSLFKIKMKSDEDKITITFEGRGSGHGVGLSQKGAKVLAEHYSWTYERILKFYYAGTRVCTLAGDRISDNSNSCASYNGT